MPKRGEEILRVLWGLYEILLLTAEIQYITVRKQEPWIMVTDDKKGFQRETMDTMPIMW